MSQRVSGGFNPEHLKKYPGLAGVRMALGMTQDQLEAYVRRQLGAAAVEELKRREKEAGLRRELRELQKVVNEIKKRFPKEVDDALAEQEMRLRSGKGRLTADQEYLRFVSNEKRRVLTTRPYTARDVIEAREKRWKGGQ